MPTGPGGERLRIVYRSYAGENTKGRPPYYSKRVALLSLLRAARAVTPGPELIFLNDGPMPPDRLALMASAGTVVPVKGGSNRRSYRAMLALEAAVDGPAESVVWFSEDDYLYRPDALQHLVAGAAALPTADYFAMYGDRALDTARTGRRFRVRPEPGAEGDPAAVGIDGVDWYRAVSTTSTYGVRRRVLREDVRLLRTCPFTGGAWDSTTCLLLQGFLPFDPADLRRDLLPGRAAPRSQWPRSIARGLVRVAASAGALCRRSRRVLVGSDPELIFHMEAPEIEPRILSRRTAAIDWAALAAETLAWGRDHGLAVPAAIRG